MAARKFPSGIDLANQQAKNLADGSAATDAVTLQQLQAMVRGLDWKASVRAASTANVTVASPGASIDGVTLSNGDRVLLKNQTTASENGIYDFNGAASPLTRSADAVAGTLTSNASVYVSEGTTQADTQWVLTTNDPITVGTTSLTFTQFGGGTTYSAGTNGGLQLSSNAFSILLPASSGLTTDATGLHIDKTIVMTRFSQNFGDGSATSYTITHNLGTKDVHVTVYDNTSNAEESPDVVHTSTTAVTINYGAAPATNSKRAVVIG